jgi:hypothetical protein
MIDTNYIQLKSINLAIPTLSKERFQSMGAPRNHKIISFSDILLYVNHPAIGSNIGKTAINPIKHPPVITM